MNRSNSLSLLVVIGAIVLAIASTGESQVGPPKQYVALQPNPLGSSQSGHLNISDNSRAGQFIGGGSGLTGLNASNISSGTLADTHLSANIVRLNAANSFGNFTNSFSGLVGIGTLTPATPLHVVNTAGTAIFGAGSGRGIQGNATATTGITYGVYGLSVSDGGAGVFGTSTHTGGLAPGVHGRTAQLTGTGVFGEATSATGANFGGRFSSASSDGVAVNGIATSTFGQNSGGKFETNSSNGIGLEGTNHDISGFGIGILGRIHSDDGTAVAGYADSVTGDSIGGLFQSSSPLGVGVRGVNNNGAGEGHGGMFTSYGADGIGSSSSGSSIGARGFSGGALGTGVFGESAYFEGVTFGGRFESISDAGRGVYAVASTSGSSHTPYGVRGQANPATLGYGVYAVGDLGASGVKSFRIDHPFDPENKYLLHYSSESPFPQNFYNGNAVTDEKGYAWVELPYYFNEINANFKYQLTIVDDGDANGFVQAKISQKIKGNRFQIRTSAPYVEVSWRVDADRNDNRIKANRPTDEREKHGPERGKYEHPEYYNQSPDRGMDYAPKRVRTEPSMGSRKP